jgi:hypothetical protein
VVVDEAQNFRNETGEDWFKSIFKILNWPNDSQQHYDNTSLYIFCDQLQKIRREYCGLSILDSKGENQMSNLFPTECRLSTVIRNSRKIYEQWEKIALKLPDFEKKNQLGIGHDYEGRDVNVVNLSSSDENEIFSTVKETIVKILDDKGYMESDVAVLFNKKDIAKRFAKHIEASSISVTNPEEFPRRGLIVDSFRRFSGLEAHVVIAVAPKSYSNYENEDEVKILLYSRAMVELHIIE